VKYLTSTSPLFFQWQERYFAICNDKQNNLNQPISRGEFMDTASFLEQRGLVNFIGNTGGIILSSGNRGGAGGGGNKGVDQQRSKKVKLSIHPDDVKSGVADVGMLKDALERELAKFFNNK
jgi:hypothetical protein